MAEPDNNASIFELMWAIRKFTRSTLILQHVIADAMGLHVTDAECIDFLQEMGPSTAGDLAKATRLTTGAITNVIDRLERAGFVRRGADPNDRRKVIVTFLPEKHATGAKIHYGALANAVQQLLSGYNEEQLRFLINHTQALTEIYQGQTKNIETNHR
jgi:MarR family transcriptional regulator, organic hydroperoxide resistance regulator